MEVGCSTGLEAGELGSLVGVDNDGLLLGLVNGDGVTDGDGLVLGNGVPVVPPRG